MNKILNYINDQSMAYYLYLHVYFKPDYTDVKKFIHFITYRKRTCCKKFDKTLFVKLS